MTPKNSEIDRPDNLHAGQPETSASSPSTSSSFACAGRRMRASLLHSAGKAERHHVLPESGWVSFWIRREGDEAQAIELLRSAYDRATTAI